MTIHAASPRIELVDIPAPLGARVCAALLDGLGLGAIVTAISWVWLAVTDPRADDYGRATPLVVSLFAIGIGLYIFGTGLAGRTLGMRATGLRIVRSKDGTALGARRAVLRSAVLLAVVIGIVWAAKPLLLVPYVLWMLFNRKYQLPHDQIAGSTVVRAASGARLRPGGQPQAVALAQSDAQALLSDLHSMQRRAHGDLHTASVPIAVLGLLALGGAASAGLDLSDSLFWVSWLYWAIAAPLGLTATALWFRALRRRQGAGTGARPLVIITVLVGCAAIVAVFLPLGGVLTAAGFIAVARTQRSRALGMAAALFGLVVFAEQPFRAISTAVTNHHPHAFGAGVMAEHGSTVVFVLLGLILLLTGAVSLRTERAG